MVTTSPGRLAVVRLLHTDTRDVLHYITRIVTSSDDLSIQFTSC